MTEIWHYSVQEFLIVHVCVCERERVVLPVYISPAHLDSEGIWADCWPHDISVLSQSDVFSPSLPPSAALQSFDMSSPTTKTEVGRLTGATAASGCLALKPPANTAGSGGGEEMYRMY